jgi:NADP-dependent 3-hydroxy acid dehydrogenase YdfG
MRKLVPLLFLNITILPLNQTSSSSVKAAGQHIPAIDTLILNGAMGYDDHLTTVTSEYLSTYLCTNVIGPHRVINAVLSALCARKTRHTVWLDDRRWKS